MSAIGDVLSGRAQWCAIEADCSEVLPMLPPKSVAHVITDPPYETEAHTLLRRVKRSIGGDGHDWGKGDPRIAATEPLAFPPITPEAREAAAVQYGRLARRWCIVFCQIEAAMRWQDALVEAKSWGLGELTRRRIGVWVKPDGQPQLSGDRPGMGFESIVFAHAPGRSRWNGGGRSSVFTHNKFVPGDGPNVHPTQKPIPLLLELVELFTDPGEIVLDPFMGSGSLGIACVRLGRCYIGMDNGRNADGRSWASIAKEGIEAETLGISRSAHVRGQGSLFGPATHP